MHVMLACCARRSLQVHHAAAMKLTQSLIHPTPPACLCAGHRARGAHARGPRRCSSGWLRPLLHPGPHRAHQGGALPGGQGRARQLAAMHLGGEASATGLLTCWRHAPHRTLGPGRSNHCCHHKDLSHADHRRPACLRSAACRCQATATAPPCSASGTCCTQRA